ncbi:hypothetical protein [Nitrincola sp. A-D6]|uniref:hypothetical protein n=1 Tax=Nitrincola sp. A-D6 TaxID=1545442 RepID=UPI00190F81E5|nr:hypothetical protein [Nitrincola sp. A-D6]
MIDHLHQDEILSGNAALLMLHGVGAALGPATAGWIMSQTSAHALPVYFSTMFVICAVYSHIQARRMRDTIVEESAHYVPMVRTSPVVLEMMLDDQTPDEPTDEATDLEMEPHTDTEEALQEESTEQENTPKTPLDKVPHKEETDPSNDTDKPDPTDR